MDMDLILLERDRPRIVEVRHRVQPFSEVRV